MKISDILVEKIELSHNLQQQLHTMFKQWLNMVDNLFFEEGISMSEFFIKHRHHLKTSIQPKLQKLINDELHKKHPDHFCKVSIHLWKQKKNDGDVERQWVTHDYTTFVNRMRLMISESELYDALSRDKLDSMAIHLTSVVMHEMVHLEQGIRSQWKNAETKYHFNNTPVGKKYQYFMDLTEIEAHAQQTASKIIMFCLNTEDPANSFKQILPLIRKQHPFLIGRDSSHRQIVELMRARNDQQSQKAIRLYFKKVYEKISEFLTR